MSFNLKISDKIILFIVLCVFMAVTMVMAGGMLTLRQLAYEQQELRASMVVQLLEAQRDIKPDTFQFAQWLPNWLRVNHIVRMDVSQGSTQIYSFTDHNFSGDFDPLIRYSYALQGKDNLKLQLWQTPPFYQLPLNSSAYLYTLIGLLIVLVSLWIAIQWLKRSFSGAELLERRGRRILNGNLIKAQEVSEDEWPKSASLALSELIAQLQDVRKDRARFDRLIRQNAFVDELTGLGNRTQFINRLESELSDVEAPSGFIQLIYLKGLDEVTERYNRSESERLLQQFAQVIASCLERHVDVTLARFGDDQFAMLLPLLTHKEAEQTAVQLLKQLARVRLPERIDANDFFYIGIAGYQFGEQPDAVLELAENALRIAQKQGCNSWFVDEQEVQLPHVGKGSVRWRVLLENAIAQHRMAFFEQLIVDEQRQPIAFELLARIREDDEWITTGVFMPWVAKCGLIKDCDGLAIERAIERVPTALVPVSINLDLDSLLSTTMIQRLLHWAMESGREGASQLIVELEESQLARLNAAQVARIIALRNKGIGIAVDRAGHSVVSTQYIADIKPNYVKLHPSLVRDIHLREVNRLAISSLLASVNNSAKIIAVGVENHDEWEVLLRLGVSGGQGHYFHRPEGLLLPQTLADPPLQVRRRLAQAQATEESA